MNCNEFQHWLLTRDIFSNETPGALFHIKTCAACKRLYMMDKGLEKEIQSGFICEELPKNLVSRIDMALDQEMEQARQNKPLVATLTV